MYIVKGQHYKITEKLEWLMMTKFILVIFEKKNPNPLAIKILSMTHGNPIFL